MAFKIIFALTLLLHATSSFAVKFHSYINDKGETVFSNVPKRCVKNSLLTCLQYHPVMSSGNPKKKLNQSRQKTDPPKNIRFKKSTFTNAPSKVGSQQLDVLDRIVERYNFINEYFPGKPNPEEAIKVQQHQKTILDVLQVIRNATGGKEKISIDKAIDILRSNHVQ